MTPAEKQAFALMREALKHGIKWMNIFDKPRECLPLHEALAAADAVAEQSARHVSVAKTGKAYIDVLIDELLIPSSAMSASDLEALHREVASVLYYIQTPVTPQGPQPMPDLTTLHANGAKAWAGVNAQDLREGKPVGEQGQALQRLAQLGQEIEAAPMSRDIPLGTMLGLPLTGPGATSLAYQVLARKTLETDAERILGARQKMMDDYSSDILARQGDDPKCE